MNNNSRPSNQEVEAFFNQLKQEWKSESQLVPKHDVTTRAEGVFKYLRAIDYLLKEVIRDYPPRQWEITVRSGFRRRQGSEYDLTYLVICPNMLQPASPYLRGLGNCTLDIRGHSDSVALWNTIGMRTDFQVGVPFLLDASLTDSVATSLKKNQEVLKHIESFLFIDASARTMKVLALPKELADERETIWQDDAKGVKYVKDYNVSEEELMLVEHFVGDIKIKLLHLRPHSK
jgi:hypothetical protein